MPKPHEPHAPKPKPKHDGPGPKERELATAMTVAVLQAANFGDAKLDAVVSAAAETYQKMLTLIGPAGHAN